MPDRHDIVIRGGTVVDGTGAEPFEADVAIDKGRITVVGKAAVRGREEIDARGKLVTPGFVDLHTHYDAQVTWANEITPSSWNGVTTAVIGNCGVGFAPCHPSQRDMLVKLMEGVEDIPEVVLTEGLPWNWQSFEDYLDALDQRPFDLDVVTQVPHAALRVYVMGQRGADREPATPEDRARMAALAAAGVRAGALGFSTSRTLNHKTKAGIPIPTLKADEAELMDIAMALEAEGAGWLQVISDFDEPEEEMALLRRLAERSGRPMSITVLQRDNKPEEWRRLMARMAEANRAGVRIQGQVLTRPTGIMLGFEISQNPFVDRPSWKEIEGLPFAERMQRLVTPEFRARLLAETGESTESFSRRVSRWDRIFPLGDPPDYEPAAETSIAARAAREGRDPAEVAYDLLLEKGGKSILYRPLSNYTYGTLDTVHDMMCHPNSLIGLGDGGAHVGILSDASAITYMLTHWTRDRTRGPKLPLAWAVKRLTSDNARAIGLDDRGVVRRGAKADLNVIDFDRLRLHAPEVRYDLPSGGRRLVQRVDGYEATLVSGEVVNREGKPTGKLPGRLVRGAKSGGIAEAAE
ncbi:MAG: amidohydrolase family protein [Hyphomicrobiaceae bacterium]